MRGRLLENIVCECVWNDPNDAAMLDEHPAVEQRGSEACELDGSSLQNPAICSDSNRLLVVGSDRAVQVARNTLSSVSFAEPLDISAQYLSEPGPVRGYGYRRLLLEPL